MPFLVVIVSVVILAVGFFAAVWIQPWYKLFLDSHEDARRWRNYAWDLQAILRRQGIEPPPVPKIGQE